MQTANTTKKTQIALWAALFAIAITPALFITTAFGDSHGGGEHNVIHEAMEQINDGYKLLRRNARRPERLMTAENVELVISMQQGALTAMHSSDTQVINEITDEAKKKEMVVTYKTIMGNLVKTLIDLEIAIESGNADAAVELVGKLVDNKAEGHEVFIPAE